FVRTGTSRLIRDWSARLGRRPRDRPPVYGDRAVIRECNEIGVDVRPCECGSSEDSLHKLDGYVKTLLRRLDVPIVSSRTARQNAGKELDGVVGFCQEFQQHLDHILWLPHVRPFPLDADRGRRPDVEVEVAGPTSPYGVEWGGRGHRVIS